MFKKRQGPKQNTYIRNTSEKCIKEQDPKEAHKYLGIQESYETQHKNKNDKLSTFRLVLGTELSATNTIQAIGSLAVPILRYSFGTVNPQATNVIYIWSTHS